MTVILTILKIIGITVLSIIALVLLILALVLFVPIRYRIRAKKPEEDGEISANAAVSYLLHIISGGLVYEGSKTQKYLKVFGIRIRPKKERKKKETLSAHADREETETTATDTESTVSAESTDSTVSTESTDSTQESTESTADTRDQSESEREDIIDRIEEILDAISSKYEEYSDRIERLRKKIRYWDRMLNDKRNKAAFQLIKKETLRLLRKIAPRKIKGLVHFGFEDPATTGQILVYLAMIYPVLPRKLVIDPGFEDTDIYGNIDIKGHLCLVTVAYSLCRLLLNKDCRRLYRLYRRKEEYCQ